MSMPIQNRTKLQRNDSFISFQTKIMFEFFFDNNPQSRGSINEPRKTQVRKSKIECDY